MNAASPLAAAAARSVRPLNHRFEQSHSPSAAAAGAEELERLGIGSVVLAGFMTHACINSTARGAFNLGYHATIVANATATRDLPAAGGGVVPAEHVQAASLAAAGDIFAVIVTGLEAIG